MSLLILCVYIHLRTPAKLTTCHNWAAVDNSHNIATAYVSTQVQTGCLQIELETLCNMVSCQTTTDPFKTRVKESPDRWRGTHADRSGPVKGSSLCVWQDGTHVYVHPAHKYHSMTVTLLR